MSRAELDDLRHHGQFRGLYGFTTAKWFADHLEDAVTWGRWFEKTSGIPHVRYIMIDVPDALADLFEPIGRRDGVGPARCATIEQLDGVPWIEVVF